MGARLVLRPVADAGEGTVDAFVTAGAMRRTARVSGPLGEPIVASYAMVSDLAVIEAAQAAGLHLPDPGPVTALRASTRGVGELVRAALDEGCRRIVLGLGCSATTDDGAGLAAALGARWLDADGRDVPPGGGSLHRLTSIDITGLDPRIADVEVTVACDVDNPLLGPEGAAAVFAPQKGARDSEVEILENGLVNYAVLLRDGMGVDVFALPGAGAAGGLAAGAVAFLGARITSGSELLLDLLAVDEALNNAGLVITGEGSLDHQSLRGRSRSRSPSVPRAAASPWSSWAGASPSPPNSCAPQASPSRGACLN